jgi:hypothetical protein
MLLAMVAFAASGWFMWRASAQGKGGKTPPNDGRIAAWPSLAQQLEQDYYGRKVQPGTALEKLIRDNQDFSLLRADEATDKRGLPAWLRVWWRKQHPEVKYSAEDPTGGYPLVAKEVLEWMITHQDLQASVQGSDSVDETGVEPDATIGTNTRVSGLQTVPRSESDIRINYWDGNKILSGSNNIGGSGRQGMYRSTDGGASWSQTELPLTSPDTFHSDPTVDWTSDGRAWSSTLGINGGTLRLRNYFSTDNGATWTLDATPSGAQTNVDKQMVWVDHSATSPFANQQYAIWHNGAPAFMSRRTAGASGAWSAPVQVSGAETTGTSIGADVKTNSAGEVFGFWPDTGSRRLVVVKSTNGGTSYSAATTIATTFDSFDIGVPSFNNRRILIYTSGGAYKTATKNNVYVAWTDLSGNTGCTTAANEPGSNAASTCKTRIWFSRSTNGGTTWSAPVRINNQAGLNDQFNQWLAVDETTGQIAVMYYDTVADSTRKKTDVWYQSSCDDGVTWSAAQKVTTAQTDETIAGANAGNQYGDYNGLSGNAGVLFPSWTDRRNNAREEIYTAKITDNCSTGGGTPAVVANGFTITAGSCGTPATAAIDPNENVTVNFTLINNGTGATGPLTATLQATGGVTLPSAPQNYGVLAAGGGTATRSFTFKASGVCGGILQATLSLTDGTYSTNVIFSTALGGGGAGGSTTVSIGSQNFDSVVAPNLPAGWTTARTGAAPPAFFATGTSLPDTAPNNAFSNGAASVATNSLISPDFTIPAATTPRLTFRHRYAFEGSTTQRYDGAILEMSVNGGVTFNNVTSAAVGGTFSTGGYTGAINSGFGNPLGGQNGWASTITTYQTVTLNIPASSSARTVRFRWRAGWDSSVAVANPAWRIDSINFTVTSNCPTCP